MVGINDGDPDAGGGEDPNNRKLHVVGGISVSRQIIK